MILYAHACVRACAECPILTFALNYLENEVIKKYVEMKFLEF